MTRANGWKIRCGALLLLSATAFAAPSITLSKKTGPPTSEILVSGSGFEPNVGVDIYFDTKDEALVVTNNEGNFHDARIHAPSSAHPGEHWVTALERNNDKGDQKPFVVNTNWTQLNFSLDHDGLNPYENVLNTKNVGNLSFRWNFSTNNGISSPPAIVDGIVYIGSQDNNVYALNARTGALVWKHATFGPIFDSSPAVVNGVVYTGSTDSNVYALNAKTGDTLWTYTTGGGVATSPAVDHGVVYISSDDGNVYGLDAKTGSLVWKYMTDSGGVTSPAVVAGVVYAASQDVLYALNEETGALLWTYDVGSFIESNPAVENGVIYFGSLDNNLYALSTSTGTFLWKFVTGGEIESSPAVANGKVYFSSDDGNFYALQASTGQLIWVHPKGSSAVVANGVVYTVDEGPLALDANTGALLYQNQLSGAGPTTPAVANGVMYFGFQGLVWAYSLSVGDLSTF